MTTTPLLQWDQRLQVQHPKSEPQFWSAELCMKYMAIEIADLRETIAAAQDAQIRDAERYQFLRAEAYEAVVPHGNKLNGRRTAWITKLYPGYSFDEAIDAAITASKGAA